MEDFYDTSGCRDLLFHAREHRFTLPQIKEILAELELDFLKFNVDWDTQQRYALRYPGELARADLNCWTQFEVENPSTFLGMYNFYVHGRAQRTDIDHRSVGLSRPRAAPAPAPPARRGGSQAMPAAK